LRIFDQDAAGSDAPHAPEVFPAALVTGQTVERRNPFVHVPMVMPRVWAIRNDIILGNRAATVDGREALSAPSAQHAIPTIVRQVGLRTPRWLAIPLGKHLTISQTLPRVQSGKEYARRRSKTKHLLRSSLPRRTSATIAARECSTANPGWRCVQIDLGEWRNQRGVFDEVIPVVGRQSPLRYWLRASGRHGRFVRPTEIAPRGAELARPDRRCRYRFPVPAMQWHQCADSPALSLRSRSGAALREMASPYEPATASAPKSLCELLETRPARRDVGTK